MNLQKDAQPNTPITGGNIWTPENDKITLHERIFIWATLLPPTIAIIIGITAFLILPNQPR